MTERVTSMMVGFGFVCLLAAAQAADRPAPKVKGAVLDFEADVIEGEKRKPDLFIQMEGNIESMDSVLYSRDDFNDYHDVDRKWRPRVRKLKGEAEGGKK